MLYKVTHFGNAVNYGSEQFFMCPMFVTECFYNKCLNCQPCVQFIFSPGCESDMILSVMTHGFDRYKCLDAWETFLHTLSQLLSKLDSAYFTNMDTEVVLDTKPDKECAAFLARPEEAANKVQQCVSSDSIPTGPEVTSKMRLQENIPCFDHKGQQAVIRLFGHLQDTHNHMSQVAKAVVNVSEVSSPEQFTFVLQLAVRPIIQLKIPPHLSAPTELKFEKERLNPEEMTEENCCNLILHDLSIQNFPPLLLNTPRDAWLQLHTF